MEMKKCFIVVDDENYIRKQYQTEVADFSDLYLIDTTANAEEAVKLVRDYTPDAVILDIELNDGSGSGISFLEDLKNLSPDTKPLILVVTNITSSLIHERIHELGGDFIITKNKPDYSVAGVLSTLSSLISTSAITHNRQTEASKAIAQAEYATRRKDMIVKELDLLGFKPSLKGTQYLRDAIELNLDTRVNNVNEVLAKKYAVTADSVDKAMRHAINTTWQTAQVKTLLAHYTAYVDPKRGTPTATEFIFHYVDKIKRSL